jgi:hypothetical protein
MPIILSLYLVLVQSKCSFVYHVVISRATMKSSLRMRAVNEIYTMCRNSFSKSTSDMIMIAAPSGGYVIIKIKMKRL